MIAVINFNQGGYWAPDGSGNIENINQATGGVIALALAQAPNVADVGLIVTQSGAGAQAAITAAAGVQSGACTVNEVGGNIFTSQSFEDTGTGELNQVFCQSGSAGIEMNPGGGVKMRLEMKQNEFNVQYNVGANVFRVLQNGEICTALFQGGPAAAAFQSKVPVHDQTGALVGYINLYL